MRFDFYSPTVNNFPIALSTTIQTSPYSTSPIANPPQILSISNRHHFPILPVVLP